MRVEFVIEDIAELAAPDELANAPHGRRVDERVVDHQRQAAALGLLDQPAPLVAIGGHRLFDQHVLAGLERAQGERKMGAGRRGDRHRLNLRIREDLVEARGGAHRRILPAGRVEPSLRMVEDPANLAAVRLPEVADEIGPPVAVADHSDADHSLGACPSNRVFERSIHYTVDVLSS